MIYRALYKLQNAFLSIISFESHNHGTHLSWGWDWGLEIGYPTKLYAAVREAPLPWRVVSFHPLLFLLRVRKLEIVSLTYMKEFVNTHSLMCSDISWASLRQPTLKSNREFFQTRPALPHQLEMQDHWNEEWDVEERWRPVTKNCQMVGG